MKNLEEPKNNDKSKEIRDTAKIIQSQRILTTSTLGKKQHTVLPNAIINDAKHVIKLWKENPIPLKNWKQNSK